MKRIFALFLLLVLAAPAGVRSSYAQQEATVLEQVAVDIWPDFDRSATLVLLTLTRPADAGEETLTLPLPDGADVNAVARISPTGDMLTDQISWDDSRPDQLVITTDSPQIRIEYYTPYQADGLQRQIAFDWTADLAVDELVVSVQQPAAAADLELTPAAAEVTTGRDGLTYHTLAPVSLAPGEAFRLVGAYRLNDDRLTATVLNEQQAAAPSDLVAPETGAADGDDLNVALIAAVAGAILVVAAVAYLLLNQRQARQRVVKPRPRRSAGARASKARPGPARFCHNCGEPTGPGDKFCRNCGAELRRA